MPVHGNHQVRIAGRNNQWQIGHYRLRRDARQVYTAVAFALKPNPNFG